jgi:ribosome biogenesis GTPase / thiamine phosphate phosphatase
LPGRFQKEYNLKKDKLHTLDIAVVGDEIDFNMNKDNTGTIETIHDRKNYISRKAPSIKGGGKRGERYEQLIASNIDNVFIVSSVKRPSFNNRFVDRLIVAGESSNVKINLVINKIDLGIDEEIEYFKKIYSNLGYNIVLTSVKTGEGMDYLKGILNGKSNLFFGQSGVGKSSLLNKLYPELDFKVGEVSDSTNKGKHTTVNSVMNKVSGDTYIIDTPGIREYDPYGIKKEDLGHYFPEFRNISDECRFNTCTHQHEPGCAIIDALELKNISKERYESYLNILGTIEEGLFF